MSLPTYNGQVIERDERFDELLDECYPNVVIAGITFSPSDVLYQCDPIAYYVYSGDFQSEIENEGDE